MTSNTITDRGALLRELESIRQRGYATSHAERFEDAIGLAAPIFDANRRVIAVLNVAGPMSRFTDEHVSRFAPIIIDLANRVSRAQGLTGPIPTSGGDG
jgi:IclR family transcriptional regulator, acetate operon repressor